MLIFQSFANLLLGEWVLQLHLPQPHSFAMGVVAK
jgi:hypothetical protein